MKDKTHPYRHEIKSKNKTQIVKSKKVYDRQSYDWETEYIKIQNRNQDLYNNSNEQLIGSNQPLPHNCQNPICYCSGNCHNKTLLNLD